MNTTRVRKRQGWRAELGVETTYTKYKVGVGTEIHQEAHISFHGHKQDAGIEHRCKKPDPAFIKFKCTNKCNINYNDGKVFFRQVDTKHSNNSHIAGYFNNKPECNADQRRRTPAELYHRPYQEFSFIR